MRKFFHCDELQKSLITTFFNCNSSHWKNFVMLVTQRSSLRRRHNALPLSLLDLLLSPKSTGDTERQQCRSVAHSK